MPTTTTSHRLRNAALAAAVAASAASGLALGLGSGAASAADRFTTPATLQVAQTAFQAAVTFTETLPAPPCTNGALFCGTANIAGYGAASWNFFLTGLTVIQSSCGSTYTATTDFTLASDGSTLALNESGYICVPGKDGAGFFKEGPKADATPNYPFGTWTVDTANSTGQFVGLGGSGSDALHKAGAHVSGTYTGTLGP